MPGAAETFDEQVPTLNPDSAEEDLFFLEPSLQSAPV